MFGRHLTVANSFLFHGRALIHNLRQKKYEIGLLLFLLLFLFMKLFWITTPPYFAVEELKKLEYLLHLDEIWRFFNWPDHRRFFYGHSGFFPFIISLLPSSGEHILITRFYLLLIHLIEVFLIFFSFKHLFNKSVAFYSALSLLGLPLFFIHSSVFIMELSAMSLGILSIYFWEKKDWLFYAVVSMAAILVLESALAFSAAVLLVTLFKRREILHWRSGLSLSSPFLVLGLFFFLNLLKGEGFSTHSSVGDVGLWQDLAHLFHRTDYSVSLNNFLITFRENYILPYLLLAPISLSFFAREKPAALVLTLSALFTFLFFILYNLHSGGRDYYLVILVLALAFFKTLERFKIPAFLKVFVILLCLLSPLAFFFSDPHKVNMTQSSLEQYERYHELHGLKERILKKVSKDKVDCFIDHLWLSYTALFCHPYFNPEASQEFRRVDSLEEADFYLTHKNPPQVERYQQHFNHFEHVQTSEETFTIWFK